MKNRLFSLIKFLVGWPFALIAFLFIIKLLTEQGMQIYQHLTNLNYALLSIGIFCFLCFFTVRSYIWYRLLKHQKATISFKNACYFWATSELRRYIPGNIWAFVGRTMLFSNNGVSKKDLAKNLITEAELLIIGAILISLFSLPFLVQYHLLPYSAYVVPIIVLTVILVVTFFIISSTLRRETKHRLLQLIHFVIPESQPSKQGYLTIITATAFFFFGLGNYFTFASFIFINPQLIWQITGIATLSFLIGYLSIITPSGFGVREGAIIVFLSKIMSVSSAAFAAIFARVVLIVSELLFISLAYLWHKTKNSFIIKGEHWIKTNKSLSIVIALFLIFCAYFVPITFLRYDNYYTGKYDLGNMSQTVWNTTQGRIFQVTDPDTALNGSRLAIHADFILLLFTPFYALWPDPRTLLFFQAIIVGAGVFFLYAIAKKILKNNKLAVLFSFMYLINPSVNRATLYDFHAVTLATTFLLATFYFFQEKRYKLFLLFAILAGLCKEQVWIIVGIFGIFLFFQHKKRLFGSLLFALCFFLSYILVSYAIPQAHGSEHFAISYYADFGDTPTDALVAIVLSPGKVLSTLLQENRIDFLKQIFSPLGYLSLLAPQYLLFIALDLLLKLLSSNNNFYQIYYQYTAVLTPFIFISAIYGIRFLQKAFIKIPKPYTLNPIPVILIYLLFASLYTAYLYGPLPGAKKPNLVMITEPLENKTFVEKSLTLIPKNASIAASNNVASHLSNRKAIYVVPVGLERAEYVVFLQKNLPSPDKLPVEQQLIQQLKNNPNYSTIAEDETFFLFKKRN